MRLLILLMSFCCLAMAVEPAAASPISQSQMENVCGSKKEDPGFGHTGCTKKCGNTWCDYDCDKKTKKCNAVVLLTTNPEQEPGEDGLTIFTPVDLGGVLVALEAMPKRQLLAACKKLSGGIVIEGKSSSGCVNPNCDKRGGTCEVICDFSLDRCMARTPEPLVRMTLMAILQNGNSVLHDSLSPRPHSLGGGEGGGGVMAPAPDDPEPPPVIIY